MMMISYRMFIVFAYNTDQYPSMAMHPNSDIVATGQLGKDPKIIVWRSSTQDVLKYVQVEYYGILLYLAVIQDIGALS